MQGDADYDGSVARTVHALCCMIGTCRYSSSSSRPRFRCCPFFTFAPREAPPGALSEAVAVADCALATKADCGPEVTDELENIRSASRNRLMRRIAPLLACVGGRHAR